MSVPEDCIAEEISDGIYLVDTLYLGREKFAASYFLEDNGEIAIIETNTNYAIPRILNAVKNAGFSPGDVKYIILTHIHLDHAGGAGLIMKELPNARLVVHPRGARHMISPEILIESVKQVYAEEKYRKLYGEIIGVPEERVISKTGGESVTVGKRELKMIDSPGHAKHHNIVYDDFSGSVFSGDAFGIGYPRFRYEMGALAFPSTSPVQFDPERALATFEMISELKPLRILLTHYGSVENVSEVHDQLKKIINTTEKKASQRYSEGLRGEELNKALTNDIWEMFEKRIMEVRGSSLTIEEKEHLFFDADLNGQGAAVYITRKNRA
ncbi:MAG: MBL fold metallo-hydrolase [Acidobacteriota bacterium]